MDEDEAETQQALAWLQQHPNATVSDPQLLIHLGRAVNSQLFAGTLTRGQSVAGNWRVLITTNDIRARNYTLPNSAELVQSVEHARGYDAVALFNTTTQELVLFNAGASPGELARGFFNRSGYFGVGGQSYLTAGDDFLRFANAFVRSEYGIGAGAVLPLGILADSYGTSMGISQSTLYALPATEIVGGDFPVEARDIQHAAPSGVGDQRRPAHGRPADRDAERFLPSQPSDAHSYRLRCGSR